MRTKIKITLTIAALAVLTACSKSRGSPEKTLDMAKIIAFVFAMFGVLWLVGKFFNRGSKEPVFDGLVILLFFSIIAAIGFNVYKWLISLH